ncbi:flavin reductase family protein [Amycolatopsis sp. YIM 10]|uniref:flavin reductase family protein n=1 Tax=Amycolatopsis sp. YIM 10 TaxID=2653857 RepID=UPI00129084B4|nr:flavin reductase family protein [Amycolatopsis sp. YIM 10]QFU89737.1 Flavin reductase (NADPH) [Amycolatopsis sp. YIM 10]
MGTSASHPENGTTGPGTSGGGTDPATFREFMGTYYTGVTVVTSIDGGGRPHGLTCNSLTSVTLAPPTLLICLGHRSGTLAAIRDSGGFVVNLLHTGGRRTAELFASARADRFDHVGWLPSDGTGLPWLAEDACAIAECRVADTVSCGDHTVVFGRVTRVETGWGSPLLYGMREFSGPAGRGTGLHSGPAPGIPAPHPA